MEKERLLAALSALPYPGFTRDIVSLGVVDRLEADGTTVRCRLVPGPGNPQALRIVADQVKAALGALDGVDEVVVTIGERSAGGAGPLNVIQPKPRPSGAAAGGLAGDLIPEVRRTIAVASGKGGVGKSTVAVNLAIALARSGWRVGLLDADIYGPSIPIMVGLQEAQPRFDQERQRLIPFEKYGIRFMSLGFLVEPGTAVIWRGPMVMKAIEQLLRDVDWGALDALVVDMPPGTGDAQLTLSQRIRLDGAVIVTTPQDVALADVVKGVAMFRKVEVPVLGVVENMSHFRCPHCGEKTDIFGHGGGRREAERQQVPLLGEVPLEPALRASGDAGKPPAADPADPLAAVFDSIAKRVRERLESPSDAEPGVFERFRKLWRPTPG